MVIINQELADAEDSAEEQQLVAADLGDVYDRMAQVRDLCWC